MNEHRFRSRLGRLVLLSTVALGASLVVPLAEAAASSPVTATATVLGGTLSVSVPGTIGFSDTLNGSDQTVTQVLAIDVRDATGSGAGWNLTATSTQFTAGSNTLPTNSVSVISGPADVCDSGATCTLATNSVAYPYYLPAGSGPPTASKIFSAASSSGLADQTVTPTFTLTIPANTVQASYTSTWTISVVSGP